MKSIGANTQHAKGLTTLNLLSLLACLVLYILIPALGVFLEVVSTRFVYILSIIFCVFNTIFYVAPASLKTQYFQKRLLLVYTPTIVMLGLGVYQFISVIIGFKISLLVTLIFAFVVVLPPVTFSLLINKLIQEQPTLLG